MRTKILDAAPVVAAVGAPAVAMLELSTPMLLARPLSYRELHAAWRTRIPLAATGLASAAALVTRAVRGQTPKRTVLGAATALLGLTAAAAVSYDPWLFAPRHRRTWVRPAAEAERVLGADTEVSGVRLNGQVRAYPARFLARPHIVTDVLGGEPVAISYCGLINNTIAYRLGDHGCGRACPCCRRPATTSAIAKAPREALSSTRLRATPDEITTHRL